LARFTGMLSGKQLNGASWEERFANYRALLGDEAKKRIALGAYVLKEEHYEQYYLRAQAYRKQLIAWFKEIFTHSAFILLPVSSETAKKPGGLTQHSYDLAGALTACSNLAGLPAISLPCGKDKDGKPFGIQMIGQKNKDMELLNAAEAMQNILSKG